MHPPIITHEHLTPEERAAAGIHDGLIRVSVGLKNVQDPLMGFKQALQHVETHDEIPQLGKNLRKKIDSRSVFTIE